MGGAISHRGPDDEGIWTDDDAGVGFVQRRLAIVDLSPAGHQPMVSPSGRYIINYNGEIYNHREIRRELDQSRHWNWRGHSDTETLLAAIELWGLSGALTRTAGMFALALWDRSERRLSLARDRFGEKPLYYGWQKDVFLFGSELKALRRHPAFTGDLDRNAIALQLRHSYIPAPHSVYAGISKLEPGTILKMDSAADSSGTSTSKQTYWDAHAVALSCQASRFEGSNDEAVDLLEEHLGSSIAGQMQADVPLGAFLSGGIDSSTVVALMQARSTRPIRTFTIGFNEAGFDEAPHAKAVARHLGTDHTELYVTSDEARSVIPSLPAIYDEPFSDSSQIPTFLVSRLARQSVTVALSGDGGDELFSGYQRYALQQRLWRSISRIPGPVRSAASATINHLPTDSINKIGNAIARALGIGPVRLGDRLQKVGTVLRENDPQAVYRALISHWTQPDAVVIGACEPEIAALASVGLPGIEDLTHRMMLMDALTYLPDDILVKVDRAAMANSLETRVPFLDHRVFEFAWSLPLSLKRQREGGKHVVRQLLYRHVPRQIVDRPKMGFGVPIGDWLRGPLRDWAENLLDEKRLRDEGIFDPGPIRTKWIEHRSGDRSWHNHLWDVLMFQAWWENANDAASD